MKSEELCQKDTEVQMLSLFEMYGCMEVGCMEEAGAWRPYAHIKAQLAAAQLASGVVQGSSYAARDDCAVKCEWKWEKMAGFQLTTVQ